jgi:hypothetical protein
MIDDPNASGSMIDDLTEILEGYNSGVYTRGGMLNQILSLSLFHPMDSIITALPDARRAEFIAWARETFDNDVPLEDFVIITQGTSSDDDLVPIARIREWFRTHDASRP